MESVMMDLMFELPTHKKEEKSPKTFTITKAYAQERLERLDFCRLKNAV
jgi:hypothetical protein